MVLLLPAVGIYYKYIPTYAIDYWVYLSSTVSVYERSEAATRVSIIIICPTYSYLTNRRNG